MPVKKNVGDHVIGGITIIIIIIIVITILIIIICVYIGTMNQTGLLRIRATRVGQETGLAQIIR